MGIQTNLKIRLYRFIGSGYIVDKCLELNLDNLNLKTNEPLFEFNEYTKVDVCFESSNPQDFVALETFIEEDFIKIQPNQTTLISSGGNSEQGMLPGNYCINIKLGNTLNKLFFRVNPSSMEFNDLLTLKTLLEKTCQGLADNIYLQRKGLDKESTTDFNINFEIYTYIKNNISTLSSNLNQIIKNPIENLEKVYTLSKFSQRPDAKSQRWSNQNKFGRNSEHFNEKRCRLNLDTNENKVLKLILLELLRVISLCDDNARKYLHEITKGLSSITQKRLLLESQQQKLKNVFNAKRKQDEISKDLFVATSILNQNLNKVQSVKEQIRQIQLIKNTLNTFLNTTWLKDINTEKTKLVASIKLLKSSPYQYIYNMYLNIFKKDSNEKRKITFPNKQTYLLYELYCVITLKDCLEKLGFVWTSGWIKDKEDIWSFAGELESGEHLTFVKDNIRIVLEYDKLISRTSDVKGSTQSQIVSSNSDRRRPDIILSMYNDDNFVSAMIIEVKYRKFENIYNKNIETDVLHQLKEYRNFDFYNGQKKKLNRHRPIESVVTLYPYAHEKTFIDETYGFYFIALKPNSEGEEIGTNSITEHINNFISSI